MKKSSESLDFSQRFNSMFKVDIRRLFKSPLVYIMFGISFILPILILVMTSFMGGMATTDPSTGIETTIESFTNVWQVIGSLSNAEMSMDLTGMCNINLVFFMIAIFMCIFVSEEFRSGYSKNIFTVRSKKTDYIVSKTFVGFIASVGMLLLFFVGALIGGAIAGLSFSTEGFGAGGIICCLLSKIFFTLVFVAISLVIATACKQKLWLSILGTIACGMLLFTMIPMITPLNSGIINVLMCLVGGALIAVGLGAVSNLILKKTSLV